MKKPRRKKEIPLPNDYLELLRTRIEECDIVVKEIENSKLWGILLKDMDEQRKAIDDNWQDITDEKKLQRARELKMAAVHIMNLKDKYVEELKDKQAEMDKYYNTGTYIPRDYDLETNITKDGE